MVGEPKRTLVRAAALLSLCASSLLATEARAEIPYADGITPGALRGIALQADSPWPASYWEYLPSNFNDVPEGHLYPMLMTLGGIGTMDNPSVCPDLAETCTVAECEAAGVDGLCRVYRRGPAVEIRQGVWNDELRPFIVIQPQNREPTNSSNNYDRDELDALVQFVVDNYPVDPRRLYILGNSQGGRAVLQYLAVYNRRMAAGTIGPGGDIVEDDVGCLLQDTAYWAFHGENDLDANLGAGVFDPCYIARTVHSANEPEEYPLFDTCTDRIGTPFPQSRMTMFENTAHNAWTPAFENVANGFNRPAWTMDAGDCGFETNWVQYDDEEYADGVYTWMLEFDRPVTDAGEDFTVTGEIAAFDLVATTVDDDAVTVTWTQVDGPPATLTVIDDTSVSVSDFTYDATYTFRAFAVDADNQWDEDEVVVTIEPEIIDMGSSSGGGSTSTGGDGEGSSDSTSTGVDGSTTGQVPTTGDATSGTQGAASDTGTGETTAGSAGEGSASGTGSASGASAGSVSDTADSASDGDGDGSSTSDTDGASASGSGGGCRTGTDAPQGLALLLLLGLFRRRRS
ncbi:MAG: hypothetical protein AAGA54_00045 [Myxococcota bacterium]